MSGGDSHHYHDSSHPIPAPELILEDGIILRFPIEGDAEELFHKIDENRDYLREWLPWLDDVKSIDDEMDLIRDNWNKMDKSYFYLILFSGNIAGVISLNWIDWSNRSFGLGYWLSSDLTGLGIVTKSCHALIQHCFIDLGLHRSVIEVGIGNHTSRAVAERLGMRLEGISKDREWLYDHFTDSAMYAITSKEWQIKNHGLSRP